MLRRWQTWLPKGRSRYAALAAVVVVAAALVAVFVRPGREDPRVPVLTDVQRAMVTELVSVFQSDNAVLQYDQVTDAGDGRGYAAGRDGFSSSSGLLSRVVSDYTAQVPDNPLAAYLPTLRTLAETQSSATAELAGLPDAWRKAAGDARFRGVQDAIDRETFFNPMLDLAGKLGLRSALGIAILYDTAVQHGVDVPDGVMALVTATKAQTKGAPADGVAEDAWLRAFLQVRHADLVKPKDSRLVGTFAASAGRVEALGAVLATGNLALEPPVSVNPYGTPHVLFPLVDSTGALALENTPDMTGPTAGVPAPGVGASGTPVAGLSPGASGATATLGSIAAGRPSGAAPTVGTGSPPPPAATYSGLSGWGCPSAGGADFEPTNDRYADGTAGWEYGTSGAWTGNSCKGSFAAMPMYGESDPSKVDPTQYAQWWFSTGTVKQGRCAVEVYVPSIPSGGSARDIAGHPARYKVLDGKGGAQIAAFTVDQTTHRGTWVGVGAYNISNGRIAVWLTNWGVDWVGSTNTYAHIAIAQVRVGCVAS